MAAVPADSAALGRLLFGSLSGSPRQAAGLVCCSVRPFEEKGVWYNIRLSRRHAMKRRVLLHSIVSRLRITFESNDGSSSRAAVTRDVLCSTLKFFELSCQTKYRKAECIVRQYYILTFRLAALGAEGLRLPPRPGLPSGPACRHCCRARKRPPEKSGGRDRGRKSCPRYRSSNC